MNYTALIEYICDDLDIDPPKLKKVDSLFGTMKAIYEPDTDTLTILNHYPTQFDSIFAIAHELRHKYQLANGFDFSHYITRDKTDLETYNMQLVELDANAYGFIFTSQELNTYPLFNGYSYKVKEAILDRVKYILANEYE